MKLITYTLDVDGNIPSYIVDGGYFSVANNLESPQDLTFIGVATEEAETTGFENQENVVQYLHSIGLNPLHPLTNEPISLESLANYLWVKLNYEN